MLVNGQVTIEDDKETGNHSGQLLRGGKADSVRMQSARSGVQALEAAE